MTHKALLSHLLTKGISHENLFHIIIVCITVASMGPKVPHWVGDSSCAEQLVISIGKISRR